MNALDIFIIVIVVIQAAYWARIGFIQGIFSIAGFWTGFIAGAIIAPFIIVFIDEPGLSILAAVAIIFGSAALVGTIGRIIGVRISRLTHRLRLGPINTILGALTGAGITLLGIWLIASLFSGIPFREVNHQISSSTILQSMNDTLPPAPAIIAGIGGMINPQGFPQVFVGLEPRPVEPVDEPTTAEVESAIAAAGTSTVRIEGTGCGGLVTGSGFIVDEGLIATNAHVVAGIDRPQVVDTAGSRGATVIYFDSQQDIAILRTDGLAGDILEISETLQERGTPAVALGYPEGGRLRGASAAILRNIQARGFDIYGERAVTRSLYELQGEIVSGNSGGPVVLPDGTVVGIVVSRSASNENIGYGIVSSEVVSALEQASRTDSPVETGRCVRN